MFFQHASEERFRSEVEAIVGRRVVSFLSGMDITADTAAEFFIFEPRERPELPSLGTGL